MASRGRGAAPRASIRIAWIVVAIILGVFAVLRLRVAGVPLERDEGEYAYAGQLILQGVPPYQLVYNMKFPGVYYAYAAILGVFGQHPFGIRFGLMVVNAATGALLFALARRRIGTTGAILATAAFGLLSLDRWIMGVFAHATHFVILPMVAAFLTLSRAMDSRRGATYLAAGLLIGIAALMKQHAIAFLPLAWALPVWRGLVADRKRRSAALVGPLWITLGAAIPFALLCAVLAAQGVFGRFWLWAIEYARAYVSEVPLRSAGHTLWMGWHESVTATWEFWLLALFGIGALAQRRWSGETRIFLGGLLLVSFGATCPGFFFRPHYFILMLPALAMLAAVGLLSLEPLARRMRLAPLATIAPIAGFAVVACAYGLQERSYLLTMTPQELSRARYGLNPFVEAPEIARYIEEHTTPRDRIAVIGSEPEIYFYARRRSVTGYVYTYGLMEPQPFASSMQREMMHEIEVGRPAYVVMVNTPSSWLTRHDSDLGIFEWASSYLDREYQVVGVAEPLPTDDPVAMWDEDATHYQPKSKNLLYTLRRKAGADARPSASASAGGAPIDTAHRAPPGGPHR